MDLINDLKRRRESKRNYARIEMWAPINLNKASLRNKIIKKFLKELNIGVWAELFLEDRELTFNDSIGVWEGEYRSFPLTMRVINKERPFKYEYVIEE